MKPILARLALTAILFTSCNLVIAADWAVGLWSCRDENNTPFLILIRPDFTAHSTYASSDRGLLGEQGVWRMDGDRLMVAYDSGWVDFITADGDGYTKSAYANGMSIAGAAQNTSSAVKRADTSAWPNAQSDNFIGVWKLTDENDEPFFLRIKTDFTARSTYPSGVAGVFGETGIWRLVDDRAVISYDSGWIDVIVSHNGKLTKYGYAPGTPILGRPDNSSPVHRASTEEVGIDE